jgi:hypothetical protein
MDFRSLITKGMLINEYDALKKQRKERENTMQM